MEKKSINSNILIILLILIIIAASSIGIYAWAKYRTAINATATGQVAKWSFKLVDGVTETTDIIDFAFTRTDGYGKVAEGVLAPGTYGELEIGIDARGTETILEYVINVELENKPIHLKLYSDSEKTEEILVTDNKFSISGFMSLEDVNEIRIEKIYWDWPYESGDDVTDTLDAGKTMTMKISVTGYEVLEEPIDESKTIYTVNYYNGTTLLGSSSHKYETEQALTTISTLGATESGYTFSGWTTETEGTTIKYTDGQNINIASTTDGVVNLYAVWSKDITFKSGLSNATTETVSQYYNGNETKVTTPTPVTISGWRAVGWRDDTTAGDKEYESSTEITPTVTTYYAVYSRDIIFKSGLASATQTSATQYYNSNGTTGTITTPTPVSLSGLTAVGWRDDTTAGDKEYASSTTITPTVTIYYAAYSRNITFNSGIANATSTQVVQYYNSNGTTGTITTPTPAAITSWTAAGWRNDTTAGASENASGSTIAASSTTYYAVYSRTIRLKYNANSGSGTMADQTTTQYYNSNGAITTPSFTLKTNAFMYDGYTFVNWAAGGTSGKQYAEAATYTGFAPAVGTTTVSQTMYAIWVENEVITFTNGYGLSASSSSSSGSVSKTTHAYVPANSTITLQTYSGGYTGTEASGGGISAIIEQNGVQVLSVSGATTKTYTTTEDGIIKITVTSSGNGGGSAIVQSITDSNGKASYTLASLDTEQEEWSNGTQLSVTANSTQTSVSAESYINVPANVTITVYCSGGGSNGSGSGTLEFNGETIASANGTHTYTTTEAGTLRIVAQANCAATQGGATGSITVNSLVGPDGTAYN